METDIYYTALALCFNSPLFANGCAGCFVSSWGVRYHSCSNHVEQRVRKEYFYPDKKSNHLKKIELLYCGYLRHLIQL